jgi:hypothetical protein
VIFFPCNFSTRVRHTEDYIPFEKDNHKCTQPCYFSLASQTRYSEGEDGLEFFDEEF